MKNISLVKHLPIATYILAAMQLVFIYSSALINPEIFDSLSGIFFSPLCLALLVFFIRSRAPITNNNQTMVALFIGTLVSLLITIKITFIPSENDLIFALTSLIFYPLIYASVLIAIISRRSIKRAAVFTIGSYLLVPISLLEYVDDLIFSPVALLTGIFVGIFSLWLSRKEFSINLWKKNLIIALLLWSSIGVHKGFLVPSLFFSFISRFAAGIGDFIGYLIGLYPPYDLTISLINIFTIVLLFAISRKNKQNLVYQSGHL